jgi:hypothetical protein
MGVRKSTVWADACHHLGKRCAELLKQKRSERERARAALKSARQKAGRRRQEEGSDGGGDLAAAAAAAAAAKAAVAELKAAASTIEKASRDEGMRRSTKIRVHCLAYLRGADDDAGFDRRLSALLATTKPAMVLAHLCGCGNCRPGRKDEGDDEGGDEGDDEGDDEGGDEGDDEGDDEGGRGHKGKRSDKGKGAGCVMGCTTPSHLCLITQADNSRQTVIHNLLDAAAAKGKTRAHDDLVALAQDLSYGRGVF